MICPSRNGPFRSRNPLGLFDPLSNTIALLSRKFLVYHSWHSTTIPLLLIFLSTLSSLHVYDPSNCIIWEKISEIGTGTRFVSIEARDPQYYWITFQMDNTGIRFTVRVDCCLVIDPDPQNMSSRLDRVGKLIGLWCGHLFELVHWS